MTLKELAKLRALEMSTGVEFEKDAAAFLAPLLAKLGPLAAKALPALKGLAGKALPFLKGLGSKAVGAAKGMTWKKGLGTAANTAMYGSMLVPARAAQPVAQKASRMPNPVRRI